MGLAAATERIAMVTNRYTGVAIAFHWMIALLIVANVVLIWTVSSLPDTLVRPAIDLHKSFGLTVLALAIMRVLWRLTHRPPPFPRRYTPVERRAAHGAHLLLYVLILGLPISGYIHDSAFAQAAQHPLSLYGLVRFPRIAAIADLPAAQKAHVHAVWFAVHVWLGYALYALFVLHVGGALKHQILDREPELERMLP